MGLISKLKKMFNKNIECGIEAENHIVFPLKKKKYLYVKKNIVVRDGFSCIIIIKGKVADILNPGKYKINSENLPETFARVDKKKTKKLKKIRAGVYFVNKREFKGYYFCSDEPFVAKSQETGKIKGFLQGTCVVRVVDSEQLMRTIANKLPKGNEKGIADYISIIIGNGINKKVKKLKIPAGELLSNAQSLEGLINREVEDQYDKVGLFVTNIRLKGINFPKRYKKRVGEYMSKHGKFVKPTFVATDTISQSAEIVSKELKETVMVDTQQRASQPAVFEIPKEVKVVEKITCSRCGGKNEKGGKICKYCGNNLTNN